MNKNLLLLFTLITVNTISPLIGQGLTQSTEGKSSVLFRGTNIGLDIGKTELSFGINNLQKTIGDNEGFIYGGDAAAKNEEGLGSIFSAGNLVPTGTIQGFVGYTISNAISPNAREKLQVLEQRRGKLKQDLANGKLSQKEYDAQSTKLETQIDEVETDLTEGSRFMQGWGYVFGGVNALEFKRFVGFNDTDLSKSFEDQRFRGGRLGLGLNVQMSPVIFGFNYSYLETNNFKLLPKKEYSLKQTRSNPTQSLTSEQKLTAYGGGDSTSLAYAKVVVNELNADLIFVVKLDEDIKSQLLVNPYVKAQVASRKKQLLPSSVNVGCGFYFYQLTGKFLGGLYAELPDVENNYERLKPLDEQNFRKPVQRLTFGIVGRFSFNSLLNLF